MSIIWLIIGIVVAIVGAHLLVDGGVALASKLGIPTLVVGAIFIGFGTSTPELTVNVASALDGKTDLALGNILGSNLFNICMILGIVALISPMVISRDAKGKDLPMCLVSALMVGIAGNQFYLDKIDYHEIMLSGGLTFLLFFGIFMRYIWSEAASGKSHHDLAKEEHDEDIIDTSNISTIRALVTMIVGLILLVLGGEFIVNGAVGIAEQFGLTERVIGLAIVGPGTSIPELIASIIAARRRQADMVLGNVLGSNIFNIFFTLGVTAIIKPVPLDLELNVVILFNACVTLFLVIYAITRRDSLIARPVGIVLCVSYLAYLGLAI